MAASRGKSPCPQSDRRSSSCECPHQVCPVESCQGWGGSIPLEALRLGHTVIANELNPIATVILYATVDYPDRFGNDLVEDLKRWENRLLKDVEQEMTGLAPFSPLPEDERAPLRETSRQCPEIFPQFDVPEYNGTGLIYARQVTCPHYGGEAPLLNTCWLSKEAVGQRSRSRGAAAGDISYHAPLVR